MNRNTLEIQGKKEVFSREIETVKEIKGVKRIKQISRNLWYIIKMSNICVIPGEGKDTGVEKIFEEIMTKILPNLVKDTNLQSQEN